MTLSGVSTSLRRLFALSVGRAAWLDTLFAKWAPLRIVSCVSAHAVPWPPSPTSPQSSESLN